MSVHVSTRTDVLDLLDIDEVDRVAVERLLANPALATPTRKAARRLRARLGTYTEEPETDASIAPEAWLRAYIDETRATVAHLATLGVPDDVIRSTFADLGRNLRIHRRHHGSFGMETWDWLLPHYTGAMFAIGRLNYSVHRTALSVPGILAAGDWVVGMHIPESGPLDPAAVDASLQSAGRFFAEVFPDMHIKIGVCDSWLLDPHLVERLPASNIAAFARRFSILGAGVEAPTEALFFLFRERDRERVQLEGRGSSLERTVLDRYDTGEAWRVPVGWLRLPSS